jgi:hypothetical protein
MKGPEVTAVSQLAVWFSAGALLVGIFWLGIDVDGPLIRALLRPTVLAGLSTVLMVVGAGEPLRWPYGLVAMAALLGVLESYAGAYGALVSGGIGRRPAQQVQVCAAWLVGVLANLVLLNMAIQTLYPLTFIWRSGPASLLDVAYVTLLTFASGGYGDVLPQTLTGKVLAMFTSAAGLLYATILFTALFQAMRED